MHCARAVSSPSPSGVPYHVYKGVLKYLWKLMVSVRKNGTVPEDVGKCTEQALTGPVWLVTTLVTEEARTV